MPPALGLFRRTMLPAEAERPGTDQGLGWRQEKGTVRLDDPEPGQEAQADFGRMGIIPDPATGRQRVLWALIITLCFSR